MIEGQVTGPAVRLHAGGSRDLDDVITIMDLAFDRRFGEGWTRSQCAGILPMPGVVLVLARDVEDKPLGFALQRTVADEAELLLIAVAPAARRRGIGQMLLDRFLTAAHHDGASRAHLEVRDGNPALAMYRRAGFSAAGRRRKYYRGSDGSQYDALTLAKKL